MRFALTLAAVGCCLVIAVPAGAAPTAAAPAEETGPEHEEKPPKSLQPLLGLTVGTVDATRRLGFSLDLAIDLLVRKRFGQFALVTGLRPHYERFALGRTEDRSCVTQPGPACGGGTFVYQSQAIANGLSLELPLMLEYRTSENWVPFLGISGSALWLSATDRSRAIAPQTQEAIDTTESKTFAMFSAFLGLNARVAKHGVLMIRTGFRFAAYADLPGGRASPRGEMLSVGYIHEL